jgi:Ca2+-binding RTX toxin-like protein
MTRSKPGGSGTSGSVLDTYGDNDTFTGVEGIKGSVNADIFNGNGGDQEMEGMAGGDTFNGAGGFDRVNYDNEQDADNSDFGIIVNLGSTALVNFNLGDSRGATNNVAVGKALDTFDDTDTLASIEQVRGTFRRDYMVGDNNGNEFGGEGGNDTLIGGADEDNLTGGAGNDTVTAGAGGFDYIGGGSGTDSVNGEAGYDQLDFSERNSNGLTFLLQTRKVTGTYDDDEDSAGMETVNTTFAGIERLVGSNGNDSFTAHSSFVHSTDADGIDNDHRVLTVAGMDGADTFTDGTVGRGQLMVSYDQEKWEQQRFEDSGDSLGRWGSQPNEFGVIVNLSGAGLVANIGDGNRLVASLRARDTFGNTDIFAGANGAVRNFQLTDANDFLRAGSAQTYVQGRDGNDTLEGGIARDFFRGGNGNDTLRGFGGNDELRGDDDGNAPGNDTLDGGIGNDYLKGGAGNDIMNGGADFDYINYNNETTFNGDGGTHGVIVNLATTAITATVAGIGTVSVAAGRARDAFTGTDTIQLVERIEGTGYQDWLNGGAIGEELVGDGGNDTIKGNAGDDELEGGNGDDTIWGGVGTDRMSGGNGNDTLRGEGNAAGTEDSLSGDDGNDILEGGDGADGLNGGNGNDILKGGTGDNFYSGGTGNDTMIGGGAGAHDKISYRNDIGTHGITANWATGKITDVFGATDSFSGIEAIKGSRFADKVTGNGAANTFEGLKGNDTFNGAGGVDRMDYRFDDQLPGSIKGIIVDLQTSKVRTTIKGTGKDTYGGTDTLINVEDIVGSRFGDTITGSSVANNLRGDLGNDKLTGDLGSDSLNGEDGNDTLIGGAGRDFMGGGLGRDIFKYLRTTESGITAGSRDRITDFKHLQDDIHLTTIDANTGAGGNQNFTFIAAKGSATTAFTAAGQVRWYQQNANGSANDKTIVRINTDADAAAEMTIELQGLISLTKADFVL